MRSKLVHGGQTTEKELRQTLSRISTVPAERTEKLLRIALGHAADRLRDLVRRALLARLCLAAQPEPLWPLGDASLAVDAMLSDDATRAVWRSRWHDNLATIDAEAAIGRPPATADFLLRTE